MREEYSSKLEGIILCKFDKSWVIKFIIILKYYN